MDEASTLAQWQWQFRDLSLWACEHHSPAGGYPAVQEVLRQLKIDSIPIGPGVQVRNGYDLGALPDGTILTQNKPGSGSYRVYVVKDRMQRLLLGTPRIAGQHGFLIVEMPGVERPAWLDVEPTPAEAGKIQAFKREAWRMGYQAKERHRWCSTFESVMGQMGVYG